MEMMEFQLYSYLAKSKDRKITLKIVGWLKTKKQIKIK